jgi:hypothetical protein
MQRALGKLRTMQAVKTNPDTHWGEGATLVASTVLLLHHREQNKCWGSDKGAVCLEMTTDLFFSGCHSFSSAATNTGPFS